MKRVILAVLAAAILMALGCGGISGEPAAATAATVAPASVAGDKFSPDLIPAIETAGRIHVIVQADPQAVYRRVVGDAAQFETNPAVIWKAHDDGAVIWKNQPDSAVIWKGRQDGAVIWKLSPEQAVIWKAATDQAVIWKFVEKLTVAGFAVDAAFESIHAVKMTADRGTVNALAAMDEVLYITPDRTVKVAGLDITNETLGLGNVAKRTSAVAFTGLTGAGVGIAIIDSGIDAAQGDFSGPAGSRIAAGRNFTTEGAATDVTDGYGHGTHVAGLVAGNGRESYVNGYNTTFEGVAPMATLVIAKALTSQGSGTVSGAIAALEWVLSVKAQYNVRVVNMSLGLPPLDPWSKDPLCEAVQNAVNNGLVVAVAAGNYGWYDGQTLYGSIASPGITPGAITVGASDSRGTAIRLHDQNGDNDDVAYFSSRGPTAWNGLPKPDVVAPGVGVISALARSSTLATTYPANIVNACQFGGSPCGAANASYFVMSGTSMATPLTAGAAALLLQANPSLTPNSVKAILMATAQPLFPATVPVSCYTNVNWRSNPACVPAPAIDEGAGLIDPPGAATLAKSVSANTYNLRAGSAWATTANISPVTVNAATGENIIWSQGLVWTGMTVSDSNVWAVFQAGYVSGEIWGQGLVWTGITVGPDQVFSPTIEDLWAESFIAPASIAGTDTVLGGYSFDWAGAPTLSNASDAWFPAS
jgi:serine protease AprX